MRLFLLNFLFTLFQLTNVILAQSDNCPPEPVQCQSPSQLSDLICYMYREASGLNYAFVGFGNGLSALCSINFICAPGKESRLEVVTVEGFVFELSYLNYAKRTSNLWYVDVTRGESCPRVFPVRNSKYCTDGSCFDSSLFPTPVAADLSYEIYTQTQRPYAGQCNIFQSDKNYCGDYCCQGSKGDCTSSVASVSLRQLKSGLFFSTGPTNNTAVQRYLNNYGVCGVNCAVSSKPEPGSDPPILVESCSLTGYNDTSLYCKNDRHTDQLYQILDSHGYNQKRTTLNSQDVCTIATLWARGYNGKNYAKPCYDCGDTTSFCNIAIIPQRVLSIYDSSFPESRLQILYIMVEGYVENKIKETILKYFLNTC